ncbi:MAG: hypothetical protein RBT75_01845 [Anaerolineae bacterium]|jgi:hypothetical protein|nr:hypothetical protein [Anaerolineae bacterium]
MSKHKKDPLLEALKEGQSYTWTVPDGGNLASMRAALKHGQTLTMSPITDPSEIQVGDMVLVKWHQSDIFHIVGNIQDGQFLIVNSLGKINGWVAAPDILGRVTKIVEPEPRPTVETMLEQLETAYRILITSENTLPDEAQRLLTIIDDLRWYAARIGSERWYTMPRSNKWSFEQNLWRLIKQAREDAAPDPKRLYTLIDAGKQAVGLASEIVMLFETAQ